MKYPIEQLKYEHERELRRWLMQRDPELAMHRQLRDYFLAPTASFGVMAARDPINNMLTGIVLFSRFDGKSFIHQYINDDHDAPVFAQLLTEVGAPCQLFLRTQQLGIAAAVGQNWLLTLSVTPGYVVDHPAYDGVFSRVAPRFSGAVYEVES